MLIYANKIKIKQVLFVVVKGFCPLATRCNVNLIAIWVFAAIKWEFRTSFQPNTEVREVINMN